MPILLNDNLAVNAPRPTDNRYGPYISTAQALSVIVPSLRYVGLTAGITTAGVVSEYWFNDGILDTDFVTKTVDISAPLATKLSLDGSTTMTGAVKFLDVPSGDTASIDIIADPNSSTGEVFDINSDAGVSITGPYIVLDSTNPQITMPGAQLGNLISVAAIDSFGVVSLGYSQQVAPGYSVTDTTSTPVVIKTAGAAISATWVSTGLDVVLTQPLEVGTATLGFEGVFVNTTNFTGILEFGMRVNGGTPLARDVLVQIAANFNQTIGMSIPIVNAYADGDTLELMARVTGNSNNNFGLTMANSSTDLGAMRIIKNGSVGGGSGAVNTVGGVAPISSSGGTDPQISMLPATASQSGYLSAANFSTFTGKQDFLINQTNIKSVNGTTLLGSGDLVISPGGNTTVTAPITNTGTGLNPIIGIPVATSTVNGYLSSANWNAFNAKASTSTTLAGYGITDAYTKTEANSIFPTTAGTGATGVWPIGISGVAASATAVAWTGVSGKPTTIAGYAITDAYTKVEVDNKDATKQATLVNQVNIKSINNTTLLGGGNMDINTQPVVSSSVYWNYNAGGDADVNPGTGFMEIEVLAGTNRRISFSKTDADGEQRNLSVLLIGDTLMASTDTTPATNFARYIVAQLPVDMGTWYKIEAYLSGDVASSVPTNGTRIKVTGYLSQSGETNWVDIVDKPTTVAGYAITDVYTKTQSDANYPTKIGGGATGNWGISITGTAGAVAYANVSGKPTVLANTGITDVYNKTEVDNADAAKQATLVNQVNIKSINGTTLLGSGDMVIAANGDAESVDGWSVEVLSALPGTPDPNTIYFIQGETGSGSSVAWGDITGTPTTLAGYNLSNDAYTKVQSDNNYPGKTGVGASGTGWTISITGSAATANAVPWSGITSKPTTIAGYAISDAYTKTESDANYPLKSGTGATGTWGISISGVASTATNVAWTGITTKPTTIGGYAITDAYTKAETDAAYPTKTGLGASGSWGISVTGSAASAATATNATTAATATTVNDNGAGASLKMWYGTEAQYTAIGSKDATTLYFRSA